MAGSAAGFFGGGAGLVRVGVTGKDADATGGVFVTGGAAFSTGGIALVSGATFVIGFDSATVGEGSVCTGADALTVFSPQPEIVSGETHANAKMKIRVFEYWLGIYLSFFFCKRLTEISNFSRRGFEGAGQRQLDPERGASSNL